MAKTYTCLHCGKENKWKYSSTNKFCNNQCFQDHKWATVTKPRIEEGGCSESITLKKYLVEERGEECVECGLGPEYNGKPLSLQVDHVDGDSDNNDPSNLRLLCPNCHTQTPTFGNAGLGSRYRKTAKRNVYLQQYKMGD